MGKLLISMSLLLSFSTCFAESFPSPSAAKEFADKVMAKVAKGDVEGGLKMMKPYSVVPSAEFDAAVGQIKLQLPAISERFGKSIGSEYILEEKMGESLFLLLYINKFERHAMRWRFYFYRGSEGWVIDTFYFDDRTQELFCH